MAENQTNEQISAEIAALEENIERMRREDAEDEDDDFSLSALLEAFKQQKLKDNDDEEDNIEIDDITALEKALEGLQ